MKKNKKIVVLGSTNTDMVIRGTHLPAPGETICGGVFAMNSGGKGLKFNTLKNHSKSNFLIVTNLK